MRALAAWSMDMNLEKLARLPNFLQRFGLVHGLRLSATVNGQGADVKAEGRPVSVPGFGAPIWVRPTRSDYSIFWQSIVRQQYKIDQFDQTHELFKRADAARAKGQVPMIIDAGANIGLSMRTFAKTYPGVLIVTLEPDDDNMRLVHQNAQSLQGRVTNVQGAIASRSGHCRVINRQRGSAGLQTEFCAATDAGAVQAYTIDDLVAMVPGGHPWIVKLDIEGAQDELFSANTEWVGRA
ncbi:MAG: hypothetical protein RL367_2582, partial [Pseudomonadota bacterium]